MRLFPGKKGDGQGPSPGPSDRKSVLIAAAVSVAAAAVVFLIKGFTVLSAVNVFRLCLLCFASAEDIKTHRVDGLYSVALAATGFYGIGSFGELWPKFAVAALIFAVLAAVYHFVPGKSIGGADIKLLSALAFVFGADGIVKIMIFTAGLLVCGILILLIIKKKEILRQRVAMFPFISAGVLLAILI